MVTVYARVRRQGVIKVVGIPIKADIKVGDYVKISKLKGDEGSTRLKVEPSSAHPEVQDDNIS